MKPLDRIAAVLIAVVFVAGCSYSLPSALQMDVDDLMRQTDGVHQVVRSIKAKAEGSNLANAERRYNELVRAHDDWRMQVEHVVNNEINHFENDEKYKNTVQKLHTASGEFASAADAALGGDTHTTVPDWPEEGET